MLRVDALDARATFALPRTPDLTLFDTSPFEPPDAVHVVNAALIASPARKSARTRESGRWRLGSPVYILIACAWLLAFATSASGGRRAWRPATGAAGVVRCGAGTRQATRDRLRTLWEPHNVRNGTAGYDLVDPSSVCLVQTDDRPLGLDSLDSPHDFSYWDASAVVNAMYALRHGYRYRVRVPLRRLADFAASQRRAPSWLPLHVAQACYHAGRCAR